MTYPTPGPATATVTMEVNWNGSDVQITGGSGGGPDITVQQGTVTTITFQRSDPGLPFTFEKFILKGTLANGQQDHVFGQWSADVQSNSITVTDQMVSDSGQDRDFVYRIGIKVGNDSHKSAPATLHDIATTS